MWIYYVGFLAQGFFSARVLIQWFLSEKANKVVSPAAYWVCSLMGSYLLYVYGCLRNDFTIILGQLISYYIYLWNLDAKGIWASLHKGMRVLLAITPVVAVIFLVSDFDAFVASFVLSDEVPLCLVIFGSTGQLIFALRFFYQWHCSRKAGASVLPAGFWMMSLLGAVIILSYGVMRGDPVIILGQSVGFISYARNLIIGYREAGNREGA